MRVVIAGRPVDIDHVAPESNVMTFRTYWSTVNGQINWIRLLKKKAPQRILWSGNSTLRLALVHQTYPEWVIDYYEAPRTDFFTAVNYFGKDPIRAIVWKTEGF